MDDSPISGVLQFAPLRQVLEGRVKRRLRRHRLSEETCLIEAEQLVAKKGRKSEIEKLKLELQKKDEEMENMRTEMEVASQLGEEAGVDINIGNGMGNDMQRVKELERQIADLKAELNLSQHEVEGEEEHDWTFAARDPFHQEETEVQGEEEEEDTFMPDLSSSQIFLSTPSRSRNRTRHQEQNSFPSPPSTTPNTPSRGHAAADATTQASIEDREKAMMQTQLIRLKESLITLHARLSAKLAPFTSSSTSNGVQAEKFDPADLTTLDTALDAVLTELAVTKSSALENSQRVSALSTEINSLSSDPSKHSPADDVIQLLKDEFRTARLELERLLPGETAEGFSPPVAILGALLEKLRGLVERVTQQDADIDAYHEQEVSLRQQLGSRIDVNTALQSSLNNTLERVMSLEQELEERDVSIAKLTKALQTYRAEVSSLEDLITRLEESHSADVARLQTTHTSALENQTKDHTSALLAASVKKEALAAAKEESATLLQELEVRLSTAETRSSQLEKELGKATKDKDRAVRNISKLNTTHGTALALRDARVTELRSEVERVNTSLREAHSTILRLRNEKARISREMEVLEASNQTLEQAAKIFESEKAGLETDKSTLEQQRTALEAQVAVEKHRGKLVIDAMQAQLSRALETGTGYLSGALRSGLTPQKPRVVASSSVDEVPAMNTASVSEMDVDASNVIAGEQETGSAAAVLVPKVRMLDGGLARRNSGKSKKRRRYDSGLGFLEEGGDEVNMLE